MPGHAKGAERYSAHMSCAFSVGSFLAELTSRPFHIGTQGGSERNPAHAMPCAVIASYKFTERVGERVRLRKREGRSGGWDRQRGAGQGHSIRV